MKNRYILFIYHTDYPQDDLDKWIAWYEATFPFKVVLTKKRADVPLSFKYFMTITDGDQPRQLFGLDGIKDQLRPYVESGEYHEVFFHYYKPQGAPDLANWTYPNDLQGAAFSELVSIPWQDDQLDLTYKNNRHETWHRLHRCLWNMKIATQDTMDVYDFPANEMRNLAQIAPYFDRLGELPITKNFAYLQGVLKGLLDAIAKLTKKSRIPDWATAIKKWEVTAAPGEDARYPNGTPAWRNKNPGNLKFAGQKFAIGKDEQGHAIFDTENHGWDALIRQLTLAASGMSASFQPTMTLVQFHTKYAEANGVGYANFVAHDLGVSPLIQISQLL